MNNARYKDLLPGSDAVCNLEALLEEALKIPEFLDGLESHWNGPLGSASEAEGRLRQFRDRVIERSQFIGEVASARILRDTVPPVHRFGTAQVPRTAYEPLRAWLNGVIGNIERELETIERRRVLFITMIATLIALLGAIAAFASAIVESSNWFRLRY